MLYSCAKPKIDINTLISFAFYHSASNKINTTYIVVKCKNFSTVDDFIQKTMNSEVERVKMQKKSIQNVNNNKN